MAVIDRVGPYVEQLFENEDVQADLQQVAAQARQAYAAASSKKNTKKVLTDNRVRRRLAQSVAAARDAVVAVKQARRTRSASAATVDCSSSSSSPVRWSSRLTRTRAIGFSASSAAAGGPTRAPSVRYTRASSAPELVDPGNSSVKQHEKGATHGGHRFARRY